MSQSLTPPVLQVQQLSASYRDREVLQGLNLQLRAGQVIGVVGPNGAGKSTFLKAILGLVPHHGEVLWRGTSLTSQLQRVAYVPQRAQVDFDYPATVEDVVLMGRVARTGWLRRFSAASQQAVKAALERVELWDLRSRPIGELSGGQQQRVFIARSLAQEAELFLLDEPFAGIDRRSEGLLYAILRDLAQQGHGVIVVHHDLGQATQQFDELVLLNQRVIAQGHPRLVLQPDHLAQAYGARLDITRHEAA
ncbi:metal ABC transporter ATP-binding protein [Synechococcus elongatus]|uniref:Metal ABC transporter ATP-binding protein n=1 Tax=Synechococcus elongatus PCC 11802 TaxID=2283154 RepID=A0AAT9JY80_SYNEL|nr:metal ABC transporter ATP-binding protein [Synechococcus elongatus]QFZ91552.1 metal ABC transporter ATP-binding protein [Synechococcus elongatus PCC 11802]